MKGGRESDRRGAPRLGGKCIRQDFQLAIAQKEMDREVKLAKQFGFVEEPSGPEQFAAAKGSQDEIAVVVRGRFDGRPVGEVGGYLAFPHAILVKPAE